MLLHRVAKINPQKVAFFSLQDTICGVVYNHKLLTVVKKVVNILENNLRQVREDKGISPNELAKILGISVKSVNAWENGTRTPRPALMQHIEDYFGVKKERIFFGAFSYTKLPSEAVNATKSVKE